MLWHETLQYYCIRLCSRFEHLNRGRHRSKESCRLQRRIFYCQFLREAEIFCDTVPAGAHVALPFQDRLRDGGEDAFAEVAAAVVHIEAGHGQDDPVGILFPVCVVVGDQVTNIGCGFRAAQFLYSLAQIVGNFNFVILQRSLFQGVRQNIVKALSVSD